MKPSNGRYGQWAGNERGFKEDPERCVEEVWSHISRQCSRKRGYGPDGEWCKQHAKKAEERLAREESV